MKRDPHQPASFRDAKAHRQPEQRGRTIWEMFEAGRASLEPHARWFKGFHALPAQALNSSFLTRRRGAKKRSRTSPTWFSN